MNSLLSYAGWSFIPDLASRQILNFVYTTPPLLRILRLTPAPQGTPQYRRHYGVIFATVTLGYLLYTMVEKARAMPPNFYELLGVSQTVDANGLKLAFRQFAKKNHPDRPGVGVQGEALFIYVRDAFEALKDPATRFAYDRFGSDALHWKSTCSTPNDYLQQGLMASCGFHIAAFVVLLFTSAVGQPSPISFWRYILWAALLAAELSFILSPTTSRNSSTILHLIFPHRLAYQHILFLHQLFMFCSVALTRVAPYLIPYDELADPRVEQALLERTTALLNVADRETSKLIHAELQSVSTTHANHSLLTSPTPRHPSLARLEPVTPGTATEILTQLQPEMEQLIMEANLKQGSGPLRAAWEGALKRAHERLQRLRSQNAVPSVRSGVAVQDGRVEAPSSSETTPTADEKRQLSRRTTPKAVQRYQTPDSEPSSQSIPMPRTGTSTPIRVKQEEQEEDTAALLGSSPFIPSTPQNIPRDKLKSVPRTPGELPSPRPSPSPPPSMILVKGRSPAYRSFAYSTARGYFARGTLQEVEEEASEELQSKEAGGYIRARSLSC